MRFVATELEGAFLVELEPHADERGHFARVWCARELAGRGLDPRLAQASVSWNRLRGTLRGLHWQAAPHAEAKLVRCTRGTVFDAIADVRPGSPTRGRWLGVTLDPRGGRMLYVPPGLAHGFLTLEDDTEVSYLISEFHQPDAARGARFDDPAFGIRWPEPVRVVSERDLGWPAFRTG